MFVIISGSNRGSAPFLHSQSTSLCTRRYTYIQPHADTHTSVSRVLITNSARVYLFDYYNWAHFILFFLSSFSGIRIDLFGPPMARGRLFCSSTNEAKTFQTRVTVLHIYTHTHTHRASERASVCIYMDEAGMDDE